MSNPSTNPWDEDPFGPQKLNGESRPAAPSAADTHLANYNNIQKNTAIANNTDVNFISPPSYDAPTTPHNATPSNQPSLVAYTSPSGEKGFLQRHESVYRDPFFAILFLLHLVGTAIIAAVYGPDSVSNSNNTNNRLSSGNGITILMVSALIAAVVSCVWLQIIKMFADRIIPVTGIVVICCCAAAAVICFMFAAYYTGIWYVAIGLINAWIYYRFRDRIPFAHASLWAAARAIETSWGPIVVGFGMCVLSLLFMLFWSFTFNAAQYSQSSTSYNTYSGVAFYLIVSWYWTSMVIRNVARVTASGTVASFYFIPSFQGPSVTLNAFTRAVTTSFGSICLGSLIVAIIAAIRAMIWNVTGGRGGLAVLGCVADCFLRIIQRLINYFNHYAYTQVAIYGYSFVNASIRTFELMQDKFWTMVINDDLTGWVLWSGMLLGGIVGGTVAAAWSSVIDYDYWATITILSFFVGCGVASVFMSVMSAAVVTTFVVWAEDPETMAKNQPEIYNRLVAAAQPSYGCCPSVRQQQMQQV